MERRIERKIMLTAAALQSPLMAKVTKPRLLFFPSLGFSTKHFLIGPSSENTFSNSPLVVSRGRLATWRGKRYMIIRSFSEWNQPGPYSTPPPS